jgi:hypothetical protein
MATLVGIGADRAETAGEPVEQHRAGGGMGGSRAALGRFRKSAQFDASKSGPEGGLRGKERECGTGAA